MKNVSGHFILIAFLPLLISMMPACAVKHAEVKKMGEDTPDKAAIPWGITFSPNPVKDSITISFTYRKEERGNIRIYDELGRQVQKREITIKEGSNSIVVPLDDLASGDYLLDAYAGSKQLAIRKITKE